MLWPSSPSLVEKETSHDLLSVPRRQPGKQIRFP
jgi:hypothetical protein